MCYQRGVIGVRRTFDIVPCKPLYRLGYRERYSRGNDIFVLQVMHYSADLSTLVMQAGSCYANRTLLLTNVYILVRYLL